MEATVKLAGTIDEAEKMDALIQAHIDITGHRPSLIHIPKSDIKTRYKGIDVIITERAEYITSGHECHVVHRKGEK